MTFLAKAGTVGGFTLLSRVFGFGRDLVMAAVLGAGPLADAFMVAFRLPNHFRAILAEGAFNAAFVPTYAAIRQTDGEAAAKALRSMALAWSLVVQGALLLAALVFTLPMLSVLAPGLSGEGEALAAELMRITFPYLIMISLVALIGGVLNAHDRFIAAAAAPILLNVALIGTLLMARHFPSAAHAAAWGVFLGGVGQLALLILAARRAGLGFSLPRPALPPHMRLFLRRFGPALIGAGGVQIAMFADTMIATFLPAGSISWLYYADRLYQLPLAVIGIAIGTVLLPDLARRIADPADASAPRALGKAVMLAVAIGIPCALILGLLGEPIIRLLFMRGAFDAAAVTGAAAALAAYAVGLPAAIALKALVSGFHARGDTMTPVYAFAAATLLNIGLKLVLMDPLGHVGLAAATSAGVTLYALLLVALLARRGHVAFARPPGRTSGSD